MAKGTRIPRGKLRIIDRDRGYKALRARLYALARQRKPHVAVGILQTEGAAPKRGGKAKGRKSVPKAAPTLLDVAFWNEFGTRRIPQRSFIRATVDANAQKYAFLITRLARAVYRGKRTVKEALTALGIAVQGDIRRRISNGIAPPNAARTVARKKSSKPLIDTGQLRGGITFQVRRA